MWVVKFYSPKCRHSVQFVTEFKNTAQKLKKFFMVGAVDCLNNREICGSYQFYSYPTVAFLYRNLFVQYSGQRQSSDISKAAQEAYSEIIDYISKRQKK